MALEKTLETEHGKISITISYVQMVEKNQKKLLEFRAFNEEHKFFHKEELRIGWNEESPDAETLHGLERKVEEMLKHKLKKRANDVGYHGTL